MTVSNRNIPEEELRRLFATLGRPDVDDDAIEHAMETLARTADPPAPSRGFARQTLLAVRRAPLPEGRMPLRRSWISGACWILGLAVIAVGTVYGAVLSLGSVTGLLFRIIAATLQASVSALVSVKSVFNLWPILSTLGTAFAEVLTSPQIVFVLIAISLVGVFSATALARLLASDQELSQW